MLAERAPLSDITMQQATAVKRTRRREAKSCTECRRRKQKCNPRKEGGPCGNCLRRYPPVACVGRGEPSQKSSTTLEQQPTPTIRVEEHSRRSPSSSSHAVDDLGSQRHSPHSNDPQNLSHPASASPALSISTDNNVTSYFQEPYPDEQVSGELILSQNSSPDGSPDESPYGSPKMFGGILSSINTLYSLPIKQTSRNAELLHFFHSHVVPNLVSIDGQNIPPLFLREMLPWMIQSPLMPNIAIMMASATQSSEQELMVKKSSETISIQSHVYKIINQFLKQDFNEVGGEALRAVIHLAILEFFWGSSEMLWPHVKGLNQMIKLRGGYQAMNDPVLESVFVLTDYELSCCFERNLSMQDLNPMRDMDPPIPAFYAEALKCPLVTSPTTYKQTRGTLNLSMASAEILDDVRFLTLSITSSDARPSTSKIQSTASWLHKQLEAIPVLINISQTPGADLVFDIIRTTALIYTNCIATLTPFTNAYTPDGLLSILDKIATVGLSRWKEMPGIFLWILLVACPSAGDDLQGRFLRKKMAVTGMTIGMEDFGLAIGCLRAFWKVQRWISRERERRVIDPLILGSK
ncbi:hypothetical protein N431DRAFT_363266 [Stipitochalara longipes BDJ]|nr:hypothetical protein N431DRAFT_363266 [Stipitochalara longipes BDJ]